MALPQLRISNITAEKLKPRINADKHGKFMVYQCSFVFIRGFIPQNQQNLFVIGITYATRRRKNSAGDSLSSPEQRSLHRL